MKLDVIKLDGKKAGSVDLGEDIFGLGTARGYPAPCRPLAAQQGAGRYAQGQDPVRDFVLDQEDLSPEGHGGARHGDRNAPIFRKEVSTRARHRAAMRMICPEGPPAGSETALSAKVKAGELVVIDEASSNGKTAALAKQVKDLG